MTIVFFLWRIPTRAVRLLLADSGPIFPQVLGACLYATAPSLQAVEVQPPALLKEFQFLSVEIRLCWHRAHASDRLGGSSKIRRPSAFASAGKKTMDNEVFSRDLKCKTAYKFYLEQYIS